MKTSKNLGTYYLPFTNTIMERKFEVFLQSINFVELYFKYIINCLFFVKI